MIPNYPLHFLNLAEFKNYEYFQTELRTLFELYACRNDKKKFRDYLVTHEECRNLDEETCWMVGFLTHSEEIMNLSQQREENVNMCKAIQELIAEGKQEGIEQGIKVLIQTCQELGSDRESTLLRLKEKFALLQPAAEQYLAKYWED